MILAAGLGSRLNEMTLFKPKALIEINGEPLLKLVINKLKHNGFNHLVINVHHHADQIISYLKENSNFETEIEISDESHLLLDTGGAILKALPLFHDSETILVHNVDIVSDTDLAGQYASFSNSQMDAVLLCKKRESSRKLLVNNENLLVGWKNEIANEIKWANDFTENYNSIAFSGIHLLRPHILKNFEVRKCSIIDIYLQLAQTKKISCIIDDKGNWFDLGKKEDFERISRLLKQK